MKLTIWSWLMLSQSTDGMVLLSLERFGGWTATDYRETKPLRTPIEIHKQISIAIDQWKSLDVIYCNCTLMLVSNNLKEVIQNFIEGKEKSA